MLWTLNALWKYIQFRLEKQRQEKIVFHIKYFHKHKFFSRFHGLVNLTGPLQQGVSDVRGVRGHFHCVRFTTDNPVIEEGKLFQQYRWGPYLAHTCTHISLNYQGRKKLNISLVQHKQTRIWILWRLFVTLLRIAVDREISNVCVTYGAWDMDLWETTINNTALKPKWKCLGNFHSFPTSTILFLWTCQVLKSINKQYHGGW